MSHFTVAVIHDENQSVEELLAPFDENLMCEFEDMTEALKEEYETKEISGYTLPNNSFIDCWEARNCDLYFTLLTEAQAEEYLKAHPDENKYLPTCTLDGTTYKKVFAPELFGLTRAAKKVKDKMSFTEYAESYCGYTLDEDGRYGYWYNPEARWDWYDFGGRWNGYLRLKPEAEGLGEYGNDGVFGSYHEEDGIHCSEARIKDLDFSPDEEIYKRAERFWEVAIDHEPLKDDEEKSDFVTMYKEEYYRERYGTKESYAKSSAAFSTYAMVTPDGEWHEAGRMGWFGLSDTSAEDEKAWEDGYMALLNEQNPDFIFTLVDCHI